MRQVSSFDHFFPSFNSNSNMNSNILPSEFQVKKKTIYRLFVSIMHADKPHSVILRPICGASARSHACVCVVAKEKTTKVSQRYICGESRKHAAYKTNSTIREAKSHKMTDQQVCAHGSHTRHANGKLFKERAEIKAHEQHARCAISIDFDGGATEAYGREYTVHAVAGKEQHQPQRSRKKN